MKPRKWVIVFAVFAFICGSVVYKSLTILEKNKNLERLLGSAVSSAVGGEISVGRVKVEFLSIYLENVTISLATHYYNIAVRDIKVSFSLLKLIRSRGNISRSISKIIFINPQLDIFLKKERSALAAGLSPGPLRKSADLYSMMINFPVDQFLIRKGVARIFGNGQEAISLGEDLTGNLRVDAAGLYFELRGTLASHKKNLFISGIFSRKYHRNHISVRLDKANIGKPVRWQAFEIRSGTLDGACEFSFPDTLTAHTFESAGWINIGDAGVVIDSIEKPITSARLSVSLNNTLLRIDSAGCSWNGTTIKGSGTWDATNERDSACAVSLECEGIRIPSLFPKINRTLKEKIYGSGWVKVLITKRPFTAENALSIAGGGIRFAGLPLLISAKALLVRNQVTVDTCVVRGPGIFGTGAGIVNFEKSTPVYSFSYSVTADSLTQSPALRQSGRLYARGLLTGLASKTHLEAVIGGEKVHVFGVNIGNPDISVITDRFDHIAFDIASGNEPFLCASGTLDDIFSKKPRLRAAVAVGDLTIRSLLGRNNASVITALDSPWVKGTVALSSDRFELQGLAGIHSKLVQGTVRFQIEKDPESRTALWRVSQQQLTLGDSLFTFTARGSLTGKALTIDSLGAQGGVRGSGRYDGDAASLEAIIHYYNIPLNALNTWLLHRRLPIKSGSLSGNTRISGVHGRISTVSELHVRKAGFGYLTNIEADAVLRSKGTVVTMLPMTFRKDLRVVVSLDTISNEKGIVFSGRFHDVPIRSLLGLEAIDDTGAGEYEMKGDLSGDFKSIATGLPVSVKVGCPSITYGKWRVDSVRARCVVDARKIDLKDFSASDAGRSTMLCTGTVPWDVLTNEHSEGDLAFGQDTMDLRLRVEGDLLSSLEKNAGEPFNAPIAGTGRGALEIELQGTPGNVRISKAKGSISRGTLQVKPYVLEDIKDFSMSVAMESDTSAAGYASFSTAPRISIDLNGAIGKRPIRIYTTHKIPEGIEPINFGFLDMGIIQVSTPKGGVDLHLPGLMEPGNTVDLEFLPKQPVKAFTLSGPFHRLRITGTWIPRSGEFTYPSLKNATSSSHFNPLPYITWDLDLKAINRKLKYFYDASAKNRRLLRLVECYLDPISTLSIRGREKDRTLKLLGALRSYKGSVFFRKVFDLNFEAGLDFTPQPHLSGKGFDNRPIIWGSAEAVSEKNRFDRTKITLVTQDSVTGALSEKGRFYGIRFKVSSDVGEMPGEPEMEFLSTEGKRVASVGGAGELVSTLGEQYVHRFLLQNVESRLAKSLGLDVITFETSIASNYFNKIYNKQVVNLSYDWNYLAFANVGITFGRYFFYDKVFLKWRTELVPIDTLIRPEYTMGFEFQPLNYFMMDFDYGMRLGQRSLEQNPKVYMQLRLPIENIRKYFNF
jgi:hypothetical protein